MEFEGQGHGISGVENRVAYYQARFDFLERVACEATDDHLEGCEQAASGDAGTGAP